MARCLLSTTVLLLVCGIPCCVSSSQTCDGQVILQKFISISKPNKGVKVQQQKFANWSSNLHKERERERDGDTYNYMAQAFVYFGIPPDRFKVLLVPILAALAVAFLAKQFPDSTGIKAAVATCLFWGLEDYLIGLGGASLQRFDAVLFMAWALTFHSLPLVVHAVWCFSFDAQYRVDSENLYTTGLSCRLWSISFMGAFFVLVCYLLPLAAFTIEPLGSGPACSLTSTAPFFTAGYLLMKGETPDRRAVLCATFVVVGVAFMNFSTESVSPIVTLLFVLTAGALASETACCQALCSNGMSEDIAVTLRLAMLSACGLLFVIVQMILLGSSPFLEPYWMLTAICVSCTASFATSFCQTATSSPRCNLMLNTSLMSSYAVPLTFVNLVLLDYHPDWNEWCGMILVLAGISVGTSQDETKNLQAQDETKNLQAATETAGRARMLVDAASRRNMLEEANRLLDSLEENPPVASGSGHSWVTCRDSKDYEISRILVERLPLEIEETPYQGGLSGILDEVLEPGARHALNSAHPCYMGYIPSGGLFHAAIGDYLSSAINRYVCYDQTAPVFAAIEHECVAWMCHDVIGWPRAASKDAGCGGVLTSGGSLANMIALHAAREHLLSPKEGHIATVYVSYQAHLCVEQAAKFIGICPGHVRKVPSKNCRMDTAALQAMLESDVADGLKPMAVCGTAGTTNTGAVDDLNAIASICSKERLWFHVDGAYGGFFALTSKGRQEMDGIGRAHSVALDPHKALFSPYGLGAVVVREISWLLKANSRDGTYLHAKNSNDIMNLSCEQTRNWRGLRLWLPLKLLGTHCFQEQLEEKMALARYATEQIGRMNIPQLVVVTTPQISIMTFKLVDESLSADGLDRLNITFLETINANKTTFLTPCKSLTGSAGEYCIRMAVVSFRTDKAAMDHTLDCVQAAALECLGRCG